MDGMVVRHVAGVLRRQRKGMEVDVLDDGSSRMDEVRLQPGLDRQEPDRVGSGCLLPDDRPVAYASDAGVVAGDGRSASDVWIPLPTGSQPSA